MESVGLAFPRIAVGAQLKAKFHPWRHDWPWWGKVLRMEKGSRAARSACPTAALGEEGGPGEEVRGHGCRLVRWRPLVLRGLRVDPQTHCVICHLPAKGVGAGLAPFETDGALSGLALKKSSKFSSNTSSGTASRIGAARWLLHLVIAEPDPILKQRNSWVLTLKK